MITDEDLIKSVISGDGFMFDTLITLYRPQIYALAMRICGNTPIAEDAVQDALIIAYIKVSQLKDVKSFLPWLKRIVTNCCYQAIRKERNITYEELHPENQLLIEESIEKNFEKMAVKNTLYTSLAALPESLRSTMVLRYLSDYQSYQQIAEILGIPVGTVRSRLNEGKKQLVQQWNNNQHAGKTEQDNASYWNDFYTKAFPGIYQDNYYLRATLQHLSPSLQVLFSNDKTIHSKHEFELSIYDDFEHGSSTSDVTSCISSGNLSFINLTFANSTEHPDHCPPGAAIVLYRKANEMIKMHIHFSPRAEPVLFS